MSWPEAFFGAVACVCAAAVFWKIFDGLKDSQ